MLAGMSQSTNRPETTNGAAAEKLRETSRARLYALLGIMLLCWSANFIFAKIALRELPSTLVACLRTLVAGLFMWPIYLLGRERWEGRRRKWTLGDLPSLLAIGVLGLVGNQIVFVIAISRTSVAHSALLVASAPVFVLLGAAWLGQEKLTGRKLLGLLIAAGGVALLQLKPTTGGASTLSGDLIMLVSSMMFAAFTVLGKRFASEFGTVTINTFAFVGGMLLLLPYTVWTLTRFGVAKVSLGAWLSVLYMGFFPSIVGYLIYAYALRHLPASRVSSVSYLQPVLATLLAVVFLHEQPGVAFAGGASLVLGGVWMTQTRSEP